MTLSSIRKYWTKPLLAERYGGKSTRTIDRWVEAEQVSPARHSAPKRPARMGGLHH